MRSGRAPVAVDEVALGPETLADLGVEVGDEVTATTRAGGKGRLRVVGTALSPFADDEGFDEGAVLTVPALDEYAQGDPLHRSGPALA